MLEYGKKIWHEAQHVQYVFLYPSGKTVRGAIDTVRKYGGEVMGIDQALNREEVGLK